MKSKRKRDIDTGKMNRERVIELINRQGEDFIKCDFIGSDKKSGLALRCWLTDNPEKRTTLEIRLAKSIQALKSGYFKGSRDLVKNILEIWKRIFVLIAERQFSIIPGWKIPIERISQANSKGNKNRTIINMEGFLPCIPIRGAGFLDNRNIAETLSDTLKEM